MTAMRATLPQRRFSETFDFVFPLGTDKAYALTVGCYADGRVGEVFLASHKHAGSQADLAARDTAILISFALQHGATLAGLAHAMTHNADGKPEGLAGVVLTLLLDWERETAHG